MADPKDVFLQILRNTTLEGSIKQGTVLEIDKENNFISVEIEDMEYNKIPINVLMDASNNISYPLQGTTVYVATLENNPQFRFLLSSQDVESIVREGLVLIRETSTNREIEIEEDLNVTTNNFNIKVNENLTINSNDINLNAENNLNIVISEETNIESKNSNLSITNNLNIDADQTIFNGGFNGGMVLLQELTQKLNNLENQVNSLLTACSSQIVTLAPSGTFPLAPFFASLTPLVPTQPIEIENSDITQ